MHDRHTIEQLFATYAWSADAKDFDLLDEVFTTDAGYVISIAGETAVGPLAGRAEIVDFVRSTTLGQTDRRRHLITNVRLLDDAATATLTVLVVENGELSAKSCGAFRCTLAEEGGATRFGSMDLALDLGF